MSLSDRALLEFTSIDSWMPTIRGGIDREVVVGSVPSIAICEARDRSSHLRTDALVLVPPVYLFPPSRCVHRERNLSSFVCSAGEIV